ncbi:MAG TPA: threonylcarbamoyl-AMP synthase [Chloroflexi bacterium]|nr:threonylcarbamoyl-AMP synthase [Chloroflexota bacterium]HHW87805.1 threonylcarbamoyl-AMP synthase [Chloroflexota bacterium]
MTNTQVFHVDPHHPDPAAIATVAQALAAGRLVAFPTETVYGLGANALDATAVARIFAAKQRPTTDPLIVHLADATQLARVAFDIPPVAPRLADRFWPGPLTLVLRRAPHVPPNVSAGRDTVAVRVPAHPVAHALLSACDLPIAAPSANLFSRPSPTTAQHVLDDLAGRVDIVLDGGTTTIGLESTVIDLTQTPPVLLRPGGVGVEALRMVLSDLRVPDAPLVTDAAEAAAAPGSQLKHYAPHAPLFLLRGDARTAVQFIHTVVSALHARGLRVGVLIPDEEFPDYTDLRAELVGLGPAHDLAMIGRYLFARLREVDSLGVNAILVRGVAEDNGGGLGPAIRDRLFRAAEGRVLDAADPTTALQQLLRLIDATTK